MHKIYDCIKKVSDIIDGIVNNKKYISVFGIIVLAFLIRMFHIDVSYHEDEYKNQKLDFAGEYLATNEKDVIEAFSKNKVKMKKIPSDYDIDIGEGDDLIFIGNFNRNIEPEEKVFFEVLNLEVHILKNGKEICAYGEEGTYPNIVNSGGRSWVSFISDGITTEDEIMISVSNRYKKNYGYAYEKLFSSMCITDRGTLLIDKVIDNLFSIIIGGLTFIVGMTLFFVMIISKTKQNDIPDSILTFTAFMIVSGMNICLKYDYVSLIVQYSTYATISYTLMIIVSIWIMARYLKYFVGQRVRWIFDLAEIVTMFIVVLYEVLQITGIIDSFDFRMNFMMIYLLVTTLVLATAIIYEIIRQKNEKKLRNSVDEHANSHKYIRITGLLYIAFGMLELLNSVCDIAKTSTFINCGFTIFIVTQLIISFNYITNNIEKSVKAAELEKKLTENRISVMVNQIQPHFLYNSIASIQMLCKKDSDMAMKALGSFAEFLRTNMDSISTTVPIPFERELNHVKNYLYLEKVRFQDMINIVYDIQYDGFNLPPLVIQPLVENAVKYGLGNKEDGGTITISSKEVNGTIQICIEDDGVGFDSSNLDKYTNCKDEITSNNRTHVGISNVYERVKNLCHGKVEIWSECGKGTKVTITIPKEE